MVERLSEAVQMWHGVGLWTVIIISIWLLLVPPLKVRRPQAAKAVEWPLAIVFLTGLVIPLAPIL